MVLRREGLPILVVSRGLFRGIMGGLSLAHWNRMQGKAEVIQKNLTFVCDCARKRSVVDAACVTQVSSVR
jgi:hypothetical protein